MKNLPDAQQNFAEELCWLNENEKKKKQQQLLWNISKVSKVNHTWIIFFRSKKQYRTKKNILKAIGRTDTITNRTKAPFYTE